MRRWFVVVALASLLCPGRPATAQSCGPAGDPTICCTGIEPEYAAFDVESLRHVTDHASALFVRERLIDLVWPALGVIPSTQPTVTATGLPYTVEPVEDFLVIDGIGTQFDTANPSLDFVRIDRLSYSMATSAGTFTTHAWHFVPQTPNGRALIVHQGHSPIPGGLRVGGVLRDAVNDGFHVVYMSMLGRAPNVVPPGPPDYTLHVNSDFEALETASFHPLSLFLEPAAAVVGWLEAQGFSEINVFGHSGGGFTAVFLAAIDPRVHRVFESAGSQPEYLDQPTQNCAGVGFGSDYELQPDERDGIASMIDLYILAGEGERRAYHAYRNRFDNCCYFGVKHETYATEVDRWVDELVLGEYTMDTDFLSFGHAVHIAARSSIRNRLMTPVPLPACKDGIDNDGDLLVDHPADPDCLTPLDESETADCGDGIDNDGDGEVDGDDPGCLDAADATELFDCGDGIDNDGDALVDFGSDAGCSALADPTERPDCEDGIDNDGDGFTDLADLNCQSGDDEFEFVPLPPWSIALAAGLFVLGARRRLARPASR